MDLTQLPICSAFFTEPAEQGGREAVALRDSLWTPGEVLHVRFLNGSPALCERVAIIAREWTRYANLEFAFYTDPANPPADPDIAIEFWRYGGGQSRIGRHSRPVSRQGQPSMHLPFVGQRTVVLHEFGHALGLMHEHLSPAAGIAWNRDAVYAYYQAVHQWDKAKVDENVLRALAHEQTNYTHFDRASIMLYAIPAELTSDGHGVAANHELSPMDKAFIAQCYPGR